MPQVYFEDKSGANVKKENHLNLSKFITLEQLKSKTGVEYRKVDVDNLNSSVEYWKLRNDRGYIFEDALEISKKSTKDEYDQKLKLYCAEHRHEDEEIRLFLEGSGYFDVRDKNDSWIRIPVSKGDLLILPADVYHRFVPDKNNHIKVLRLYSNSPVWTAKFRAEEPVPGEIRM